MCTDSSSCLPGWRKLHRAWKGSGAQAHDSNIRQANAFKVKTLAQSPTPPSKHFIIHQWKTQPTVETSGVTTALKGKFSPPSNLLKKESNIQRPEAVRIFSKVSLQPWPSCTFPALCLWASTGPPRCGPQDSTWPCLHLYPALIHSHCQQSWLQQYRS